MHQKEECILELKAFHDDLERHLRLYDSSLDESFPDYPIRNRQALDTQRQDLTRQMYLVDAVLRRFAKVQRFELRGHAFDIFHEAVGNSLAEVKGYALEQAIAQTGGVLALIETFSDSEWAARTDAPRGESRASSGPVSGRPRQQPSTELDDRLPLLRQGVFDRDLDALIMDAHKREEPISLVIIDLDHFKAINDRWGHPRGDDVLLHVSTLISKQVRGKGKAYHYGGDEITLLLPNYSAMEAVALAEEIRKQLEAAEMTEDRLKITASFGIAIAPQHGEAAQDLLKLADSALYEAKDLGRNCVRVSGEPRPTVASPREVPRRLPDLGALTETQAQAIRVQYFQQGIAPCPRDTTPMQAKQSWQKGRKTPDLFVQCPVCGLAEIIEGAE